MVAVECRTLSSRIDFQTEPARYRHWKLKFDGELAELLMDVDEDAPLFDGYQLKLNSYDLADTFWKACAAAAP
jgi:benzoyl-CoA-dihydrodiol lyase